MPYTKDSAGLSLHLQSYQYPNGLPYHYFSFLYSTSCLTAYTNVEFSLFERTDSYYLIMGTHTGVHLTPNFISRLIGMKYKWIGHTHPGTTPLCLYPSPCDYEVLNTLNQESSAIYNSVGEYYVFDRKNGGF